MTDDSLLRDIIGSFIKSKSESDLSVLQKCILGQQRLIIPQDIKISTVTILIMSKKLVCPLLIHEDIL